jgi:hypothetical protein
MKKRLIITDLSRMRGDRVCIFGVDGNGKGMRPDIPPIGIRENYLLDKSGQQIIRPFAEIEFDFIRLTPKPPHTEDWEINAHYIPRLIRNLSEDESRVFLEKILDSSVKSIFEADIYNNQYINEGEGNRSLGTVKTKEILSGKYSLKEGERYNYRIKFSDATGEIYDLPVTDLAFREYCDGQRVQGHTTDTISGELQRRLRQRDVFLRVGLTRPFAKMYNRCYLHVSGIHAFPNYREAYHKRQGTFELLDAPARDENQIYQALTKWRLRKAEESNLPPYYILSNATLHNIARTKPTSLLALLDIKGLGKKTIKKFGEEIIELINEYLIKASGDIRDERAIPELKRIEEEPIPYVRRAIKNAIAKIWHSNR